MNGGVKRNSDGNQLYKNKFTKSLLCKDGISFKSIQWLNYVQTTELCNNGGIQIEHGYHRQEKEIIYGEKKYKGKTFNNIFSKPF